MHISSRHLCNCYTKYSTWPKMLKRLKGHQIYGFKIGTNPDYRTELGESRERRGWGSESENMGHALGIGEWWTGLEGERKCGSSSVVCLFWKPRCVNNHSAACWSLLIRTYFENFTIRFASRLTAGRSVAFRPYCGPDLLTTPDTRGKAAQQGSCGYPINLQNMSSILWGHRQNLQYSPRP